MKTLREWKKLAGAGLACLAIAVVPISEAAADGGTLRGTVLENVENEYGIDVAMVNGDGISIQAIGPGNNVSSTRSRHGSYAFRGLAPGDYELVVHTRDGGMVSSKTSVAAGLATTLNVLLISRKPEGAFTYSPAIGVEQGITDNPDVTGDGRIDSDDIEAVTAVLGLEGKRADEDVNRDGFIDQRDLQAVEDAYGRVVVSVDSLYQAQVTPGGSVAVIGDGLASIRSESGHSTGHVSWAPGGGNDRVRFVIKEDRGIASSPEIGEFRFTENPRDRTWIDVDLESGRVLDGRIGLTLTGGLFVYPVSISGDVPDGLIAFAPGGFSLYHLVDVHGKIPADAPAYGGEAYAMGKCDEAKEDVDCPSENAGGTDACFWILDNSNGTCDGGSKCTNEDADCAIRGDCKTCRTRCQRSLIGGQVLCECGCYN